MRKNIIFLLALCCMFSCEENTSENSKKVVGIEVENPNSNAAIIRNPITENSEVIDSSQLAIIYFEEDRYNFGELDEGGKTAHSFEFTNKGTVPLIISDVRSTCGCTVADWPKELIPPGGEGTIEVKFDSKNKEGKQSKPITITANTMPQKTQIFLDGFVIKQ